MLFGVLILKFVNIFEILLIWENRNLMNYYGYNMVKKLFFFFIRMGIFRWKIYFN